MLVADGNPRLEPTSLPARSCDINWIEHQTPEAIREVRTIYHPVGRCLNSREPIDVQASERG